jgi:hypothetical protein
MKIAPSANRSGTGTHDEDVDIIFLNIAANPFPRKTWKSAHDIKEAKRKGQSRKAKGKGERGKGKGRSAMFDILPLALTLSP